MKSDLKAKFLLHMIERKTGDKGFTLIELLVVIVIISILSAIALPSFLNQANKARQAEGSTYVGSINRGQQAYFLEKNTFGNLSDLKLGIKSTANYTYATGPGAASEAITTGTPAATLKGYAGRVWVGVGSDSSATTLALLCESTQPGAVPAVTGVTVCP